MGDPLVHSGVWFAQSNPDLLSCYIYPHSMNPLGEEGGGGGGGGGLLHFQVFGIIINFHCMCM